MLERFVTPVLRTWPKGGEGTVLSNRARSRQRALLGAPPQARVRRRARRAEPGLPVPERAHPAADLGGRRRAARGPVRSVRGARRVPARREGRRRRLRSASARAAVRDRDEDAARSPGEPRPPDDPRVPAAGGDRGAQDHLRSGYASQDRGLVDLARIRAAGVRIAQGTPQPGYEASRDSRASPPMPRDSPRTSASPRRSRRSSPSRSCSH